MGKQTIYFSHESCKSCDNDLNLECNMCIDSINERLVKDMKKVNHLATKVFIIAYNSNWRGQTGYMVLNLDDKFLSSLLGKCRNYSMKIYKEGRKFFIEATSHDVPLGGTWVLRPRSGRLGRSKQLFDNNYLCNIWASKIKRAR